MIAKGTVCVDQNGDEWFVITDPDPTTGEFRCIGEHGWGTGNVNVVVSRDRVTAE